MGFAGVFGVWSYTGSILSFGRNKKVVFTSTLVPSNPDISAFSRSHTYAHTRHASPCSHTQLSVSHECSAGTSQTAKATLNQLFFILALLHRIRGWDFLYAALNILNSATFPL